MEVRKLRELYHQDKIDQTSTNEFLNHDRAGRCKIICFLDDQQARVLADGSTEHIIIFLRDTDYRP